MKRILIVLAATLFLLQAPALISADSVPEENIEIQQAFLPAVSLESRVKASPVMATITVTGEKVEILQDRAYQSYLVGFADGCQKWCSAGELSIPPDPETNNIQLTKEEIESYINSKGFASDTNYFVWVDIDRQLTYVLIGSQNNWNLFKTIPCATGKNISPTTRGLFSIGDRGYWFYSPTFASGAKYWVEFNGSYLFHSVAMDEYGNIKDPTLGKRASAGCIRMGVEDAKWFYGYVAYGSAVFVN